ncbi:MAG: hypothetical protein NTX79_04195 [Candidatus Micrarchaeota archaeon]|nr:hypothetical protein [Candidatus Micrarchaeota archaeon]
MKQRFFNYQKDDVGRMVRVPLKLSKEAALEFAKALLSNNELLKRKEEQKPVKGELANRHKNPVTQGDLDAAEQRMFNATKPAYDYAVAAYKDNFDVSVNWTHKYIFNQMRLDETHEKIPLAVSNHKKGVFRANANTVLLGMLSAFGGFVAGSITAFATVGVMWNEALANSNGLKAAIITTVIGLIGTGIYRWQKGNKLEVNLAKGIQVETMNLIGRILESSHR